ncbi:hypothetical protein K7432_006522 [Basidiobolus ranarum]|uniref:Beta-lactamase-related domain-containing protein n=1 Tax=Basidiobolus ranarum TaxID=34480 RepID=A0ABR2W1J4_9FUNG
MLIYLLPFLGAVVSIVKDGSVVYSGGYGYSNLEDLSPADPANTVVRVGSISKSFTATSLMQLYENGQIELDQDIQVYLTDEDKKQEFILLSNNMEGNVTASSLLTHTSGIDFKSFGTMTEKPQSISASLLPALENFPLRIRNVDVAQGYSDHGYTLLGHAISKVSKLPFTEYVRLNVLEPLGMQSSTFGPHNASDPTMIRLKSSEQYNFAVNYKKNPNTGKLERAPELYAVLVPASSLISTADDMSKFMIAHLNSGSLSENQRILDSDTTELMHSRQFSHHEHVDGTCYGFFETNYGVGLRMVSHGGDLVGQSSQLSLFPEQKLGIFVSYNANNATIRKNFVEGFLDNFYAPMEEESHYDEIFFKHVPQWEGRSYLYEASFKPVATSYSTFEQLDSLAQQIDVKSIGNNTLSVSIPESLQSLFGTSEIKLLEVGRHTFKVIDPANSNHMSKRYFVFNYNREYEGVDYLYAGNFDLPIVFERLEFYEIKNFQFYAFSIAGSIIVIEAMYYLFSILSYFVYGQTKSQFSYEKVEKKEKKTKKSKKSKKAKDSDDEEEDDTPEKIQNDIDEEKSRQERLAELRKKYVIPDDAIIDDYEKTEANFSFQLVPHVAGVLAWSYTLLVVVVRYVIYRYDMIGLTSDSRLPLKLRLVFVAPFICQIITVAFAQQLFWWWGEIPGYKRQHCWFLVVLLASAMMLYLFFCYKLTIINM